MYHYVYRITCLYPTIQQKYYYGMRSSIVPPTQDSTYWSSSTLVKQYIQEYGQKWFTKKIIAIYPTREEALEHEIYLHKYFDVAHHPAFMNQANQTSTKFTYIHTKPFSQDHRVSLQQAHRRPEARTRFRKRMLRVCTCPHCGLSGSRASLIQWHFDACPQNPNRVIRPIPKQLIERHKTIHIFASHPGVCPYCQIQSTWLNLQSTHFDYCPKNPNQKKRMLPKLECPYCGKIGRGNAMYQWHFDQCMKNPNRSSTPVHRRAIRICLYCGKQGSGGAMDRWHFEKCRYKPSNDKPIE